MEAFKLQTACLAIILYIIITYIWQTLGNNIKCNKIFDAIMYVCPWTIIFDAVTAWSVNHLNIVSLWTNRFLHLAFYLLLDVTLFLTTIYIFDHIFILKRHKIFKKIMNILGLLSIILIIAGIGNVNFHEGVVTNYSLGFSVTVCFIAVFFNYGSILCSVIFMRKHMLRERFFGVLLFVGFVGILLFLQLVIPEFLMTSLCTTMMILGIYIVFENPSMRKIESQNEKIIESFATLVENRDDNTGGHITRTRAYVQLILKKMQHDNRYLIDMTRDYVSAVTAAAPLHDIGKIATPDDILRKPGKLTDEEYTIMKEHAAKGGDIILSTFKDMYSKEETQITYEVARYHHEKYNGRGYPEGLSGEDIPLHARVMAIADVFDAVSSNRCYREAMSLDKSFSIIEAGAGEDFDPHLAKIFIESRSEVEELYRRLTES